MFNVLETEELMDVDGGKYISYPKLIPCFAHNDRGILCYLGWDCWKEVDCYDSAVCFIDGRKSNTFPNY